MRNLTARTMKPLYGIQTDMQNYNFAYKEDISLLRAIRITIEMLLTLIATGAIVGPLMLMAMYMAAN